MSETLASAPYQDVRWYDELNRNMPEFYRQQPLYTGRMPENVTRAALMAAANEQAEAAITRPSVVTSYLGGSAIRGGEVLANSGRDVGEGMAIGVLALLGTEYQAPPTPVPRASQHEYAPAA